MSMIYEPTGKAREYSPLACNLYSGCTNGCKYCYAPGIRRQSREAYLEVYPRKNILDMFRKECVKGRGQLEQVLFCFMTDPYNHLDTDLKITREALKIAFENNVPVAILSKNGKNVLRDLDIIKMFGEHIKVGATLTFDNDKDSKGIEPFAALPSERLEMLKTFHDNGVKTWASFEPVLDPKQSINLIKKSLPFVDYYKIGKINNYQGLDKTIDWTSFLREVVGILRGAKKTFYIKHDLRLNASTIKLNDDEIDHDLLNVLKFPKNTLI